MKDADFKYGTLKRLYKSLVSELEKCGGCQEVLWDSILYLDYELMQIAIASGADVNQQDQFGTTPGYTPLLYLIHHDESQNPKLFQLLLCSGADVDSWGGTLFSPLHLAVEFNRIKHVQWLLESGAFVDVRSHDDDMTPFLLAAEEGHLEIANLFLDAGANSHFVTCVGESLETVCHPAIRESLHLRKSKRPRPESER